MTDSNNTSAPSITLAGKEWPLPRLAPRQNRIIVPALVALVPKILRARDEADAAGERGSFATLARYLDTDCYDRIAGLVFAALTRANPALTRDGFDDLPIDTFELVAAVVPIARAAGLIGSTPPPPLRGTSPTLRAGEGA